MDGRWIAVDWGTSNLRATIMDGHQVVDELASDQGMGQLDADGFEPALIALIGPYLDGRTMPVICCGMVGARQGWVEAPYVSAPCPPPSGAVATPVPTIDPRIAVFILPGIRQESPPDVMRGEETQIAGYLQTHPRFDGAVCLPGTHTKWGQIRAGQIAHFRTFMTGELFALLSTQSILRHSVMGDEAFDGDAFDQGVRDGFTAPMGISAELFAIRAASLLSGLGAAGARARLSGLLIGLELAASSAYWQGQDVALIGPQGLSELYVRALKCQGVQAQMIGASDLTLRGLRAAYDFREGDG